MSTLTISPPTQQEKISLVEALLPEKLREELQAPPTELSRGAVNVKIDQMRAVVTLIINLIQRSKQFFPKGILNKVDSITGAFDCESRAVFFHRLSTSVKFKKELEELAPNEKELKKSATTEEEKKEVSAKIANSALKKLRTALNKFQPSYHQIILDKEKNLFKLFYKKVLKPIKISKEMAYLFRSLILTVTRVPNGKPDENGVVTTKIAPGMLGPRLISRKGKPSLSDAHCKELVYSAAADLSKQTLNEIYSITQDLAVFEGKTQTLKKLKEIKEKKREGYKSLSAAHLFYRVRAVMEYIKQKGAVVIMKSIVPKTEKSFFLAMKGGEKFSLIHDEDFQKMDVFTPLIIFTAVIRKGQTREAFAKKIEDLGGFEELILQSAAADSQIEDDEIEGYREKAEKNKLYRDKDPLFFIDHVYCDTKGSEFPVRRTRRK